jgi:GNAT superfamily N-acetyltransferase
MLLGRLARDLRYRGRGTGELLPANALQRCYRLSEEIGAIGVVVDAIDDTAREFYERYGFSRFPEHERRLLLPMGSIQQLFPTR